MLCSGIYCKTLKNESCQASLLKEDLMIRKMSYGNIWFQETLGQISYNCHFKREGNTPATALLIWRTAEIDGSWWRVLTVESEDCALFGCGWSLWRKTAGTQPRGRPGCNRTHLPNWLHFKNMDKIDSNLRANRKVNRLACLNISFFLFFKNLI